MKERIHIHTSSHQSTARKHLKMDILYLSQISVGASCYIPGSCHNPPIMGYHLYEFKHFTEAALSLIFCKYSIIMLSIYHAKVDQKVKISQTVGIYLKLSLHFILNDKNESLDSHSPCRHQSRAWQYLKMKV